MAITPNTNVRLIKCPLELDNKNQLTFTNSTAQETYFKSLPYIEIEHCSYQRHNNIIRFPGHIDTILDYNYVMYQNSNYSNKWFYAYIIDMKYNNNNRTDILIAQDVFQTWQFDLTWKQSFIEREHIDIAIDTPGANLIPEDLELGELTFNGSVEVPYMNLLYVIAYNRDPYTDGYSPTPMTYHGSIINGIPSGLYYCICSPNQLLSQLAVMDQHSDAIVCIFSVPSVALIGLGNYDVSQATNINIWVDGNFESPRLCFRNRK